MAILTIAAATFAALLMGDAGRSHGRYAAQLSGWAQTPPIATEASGQVDVLVAHDLTFRASYGKLHGDVTAVSVHFGHPGAPGAPVVVLCGSGQKACPAAPADFEVVVQPQDVLGAPMQGIEAKKLESVLEALDQGLLYVNVASKDFPLGELRGQLGRGKDKEKD